ncbi:MAG: AMP-dependent synthetase, partial [Thermaerobacter sp.]|nr:AMP-dependent synthetase [Thermaerobacter sp.]
MEYRNEPVVWRPTEEIIRQSRLGQFLHEHGLADLDALRARAGSDPSWFWDAVIRMLDWPFITPYHTVLDTSRGPEWSQWFVGGTSNLALAALDRHVEDGLRDRTALIEETESGRVSTWTYGQLKAAADRLA